MHIPSCTPAWNLTFSPRVLQLWQSRCIHLRSSNAPNPFPPAQASVASHAWACGTEHCMTNGVDIHYGALHDMVALPVCKTGSCVRLGERTGIMFCGSIQFACRLTTDSERGWALLDFWLSVADRLHKRWSPHDNLEGLRRLGFWSAGFGEKAKHICPHELHYWFLLGLHLQATRQTLMAWRCSRLAWPSPMVSGIGGNTCCAGMCAADDRVKEHSSCESAIFSLEECPVSMNMQPNIQTWHCLLGYASTPKETRVCVDIFFTSSSLHSTEIVDDVCHTRNVPEETIMQKGCGGGCPSTCECKCKLFC